MTKNGLKLYCLGVLCTSFLVVFSLGLLNSLEAKPIAVDMDIFKEDIFTELYGASVSSVNIGRPNEQSEGNELKEEKVIEANNKSKPKQEVNSHEKDSSLELKGYLNSYVLDVIKTYTDKTPYLLNEDYDNYNGVTTTLYYQDKVLLKAHPSGNRASHCSGITFEVFFKAMQIRNKKLGISKDNFNGMNWDQLFDFVLHWYAAQGPKHQSNITVAVEKYGVGVGIKNMEDARPGDFIDFSRENNTGHTAVFLNWVRENNRIVGFRYWSSQQSTRGIGYRTEYFNIKAPNGKKYGNVIYNNVYIARILPVDQYK